MWLLFQFETLNEVVITRGRTSDEAKNYLTTICKMQIIKECDCCNIDAAYLYSLSHPFNWLDSPPRWIYPNSPFLPNDPSFKDRFAKRLKTNSHIPTK